MTRDSGAWALETKLELDPDSLEMLFAYEKGGFAKPPSPIPRPSAELVADGLVVVVAAIDRDGDADADGSSREDAEDDTARRLALILAIGADARTGLDLRRSIQRKTARSRRSLRNNRQCQQRQSPNSANGLFQYAHETAPSVPLWRVSRTDS